MADPTKTAFTGYWRASFTSATNWAAVTTAGVSATTGALVAGGLGLPNAGTAQNSLTPANITGDNAFTNATSLSTLFQTSTGTVVGLYKATALGTPATITTDPQFWSGSSGFSGLALDSGGIFGWIISGGLTVQTAGLTFGTSAYAAFRMRWDGTTMGVQLNGNGTEDTVSCGAPDSLVGTLNVGIDSGNANWLDGNLLEIGTLDFTMSDLTWNDYGLYLQERYALSLNFRVPHSLVSVPDHLHRADTRRAVRPTGFATRPAPLVTGVALLQPNIPQRPDRIDRAQLTFGQHASRMQAHALQPFPDARKFQFRDAIVPERVWPARRLIAAASQFHALPPKPDARTFQYADGIEPERVWPRLALTTADQQAHVLQALPDARKVPWSDGIEPERVIRPTYPAAHQLAVTGLSPKPERACTLIDVVAPDAIDRRVMSTSAQLAVTELSPSPVAPPTLVSVLFVSFQDAVASLTMHASRQQAFALQPAPDARTQQHVGVTAPTSIDCLTFAVAQQRAFVMHPSPERAVVFSDAVAPAAVDRLRLPAGAHPFTTSVPSLPDPRTQQFVGVVTPDFALGAVGLRASLQLAFATSQRPEQPVPLVRADGPSDLRREVALATHRQLCVSEVYPQPEETAMLDDQPTFPPAVDRLQLRTADQQAFVASLQPEQAVQLGGQPVFQSAVDRVWLRAGEQQTFAISPQPEQKTALAAPAVFPAAVARLQLLPDRQQAFALQPAPDRRTVQYVDGIESDRVWPTRGLRASAQLAFAAPVFPPSTVVVPTFFRGDAPMWLPLLRSQPTSPVGPPQQAGVFAPLFFQGLASSALPPLRAQPTGCSGPPTFASTFAPTLPSVSAPAWLQVVPRQHTGHVGPSLPSSGWAATFFDAVYPGGLPLARAQQPQVQAAPFQPFQPSTMPLASSSMPVRALVPHLFAGLVAGILVRERALPATEGWFPLRVAGAPPPQQAGVASSSSLPLVAPVGLVVCPDGVARVLFHPTRPGAYVLPLRERSSVAVFVAFADSVFRPATHPATAGGPSPAAPFQPPTPASSLLASVFGEPIAWVARRNPMPPWMNALEFVGPLGNQQMVVQARIVTADGEARLVVPTLQLRVLLREGLVRIVDPASQLRDEEE